MSKISDLSREVNPADDMISIRKGRVVRVGHLKGLDLHFTLERMAGEYGLTLDELHHCFNDLMFFTIHGNPPPSDLSFREQIMACHRWGCGDDGPLFRDF